MLPCQESGHQEVAASPSMAFAGSLPDCAEVAAAWPDSAQLTVSDDDGCAAAFASRPELVDTDEASNPTPRAMHPVNTVALRQARPRLSPRERSR